MVSRLAALVLIGNHLSRTQDPAQSASRPVELPSNLVASLPRSARVTKLAPNWRVDWSALAIVKRATVVAWLRNRVGAECFSIAPARQNTMCVVRAHDPIASERRTPPMACTPNGPPIALAAVRRSTRRRGNGVERSAIVYRMGLLALMVAPTNGTARAPQCPRRRIGIVGLIA
jgi:hypothetical protein